MRLTCGACVCRCNGTKPDGEDQRLPTPAVGSARAHLIITCKCVCVCVCADGRGRAGGLLHPLLCGMLVLLLLSRPASAQSRCKPLIFILLKRNTFLTKTINCLEKNRYCRAYRRCFCFYNKAGILLNHFDFILIGKIISY